jgi:hypothetical protein
MRARIAPVEHVARIAACLEAVSPSIRSSRLFINLGFDGRNTRFEARHAAFHGGEMTARGRVSRLDDGLVCAARLQNETQNCETQNEKGTHTTVPSG